MVTRRAIRCGVLGRRSRPRIGVFSGHLRDRFFFGEKIRRRDLAVTPPFFCPTEIQPREKSTRERRRLWRTALQDASAGDWHRDREALPDQWWLREGLHTICR